MNRNTELHFGAVPKIHQNRSKFDMSHSIKTAFNNGQCIPIFVDSDILPGDTVQMDMAEIVRMATPIYPVMDNLIMDLYWFFVPHRLVWDHWEQFWGQNDDPWTQTTEYEIPQVTSPSGGWAEGTIADYMGVPTYVDNLSINALPFRAYAKIWSDWFRDENLKANSHFYMDETTRTGSNGTNYVLDPELGGMPAAGAKLHDYFTSALPNPQKGPSVSIPLGTGAPVYSGQRHAVVPENLPLSWKSTDGTTNITTSGYIRTLNGATNFEPSEVAQGTNTVTPDNLYADLAQATAASINQLRTAFAIQKYYENAGRSGTRYIEYLRSVFGVESSDARLQRSEYLGGQRIPINMDQIIQTSSTDATSPQGNTAGFSCTQAKGSMFTKSFEEHGTLMCIALVRCEHSYQQGLNKMWNRKKWTDFYNPFFANLGEQSILNKEIYAQGSTVVDASGNVVDEQTFGYQEAWAEYRYKQNMVTAEMRSNAPNGSLDAWHYADDYNQLPTLSSGWIDEPKTNVDRTIAVTSEIAHQFIGDFYFKAYYTRCMPVYSVPGLIDHV